MRKPLGITALAAVAALAFSVAASAQMLPPPGAAPPSTGGGNSGLTLSMAQAKQATKKHALKYQGGWGVEVTKVTCKRTSAKTAACKYELLAPERCKGSTKVRAYKSGRSTKARVYKSGRTLCQVQNPDGTVGWE